MGFGPPLWPLHQPMSPNALTLSVRKIAPKGRRSLEASQEEKFAEFFEAPSHDKLRELLRTNRGEFEYIDFKEEWPSKCHLAKAILAFANTGDGCLVNG